MQSDDGPEAPHFQNTNAGPADQHQFHFDTGQMPITILDYSFRSFRHEVVPKLVERGIALLGMKLLASGTIPQHGIATAIECLYYTLSQPTSAEIRWDVCCLRRQIRNLCWRQRIERLRRRECLVQMKTIGDVGSEFAPRSNPNPGVRPDGGSILYPTYSAKTACGCSTGSRSNR